MSLLSNFLQGLSDLIGLANHYVMIVLAFPGAILEDLFRDLAHYFSPEDDSNDKPKT